MDVQQASYLAVEIHFASLDARSKQCALAHFENPSRQSPTIRVDEAAYMDTVTNFHLHHGSLSRNRL
jgi:hypothetical protein